MSAPTRFTSGVTNVTSNDPLGQYGLPDPSKWHTFFDDFDRFNAADWVITTVEAGAGSATEVITDEDGGVLLVTNDNADNDSDFFQSIGEGFLFATGKRAIFKARFKTNDAIESDIVCGLQITDTTPLDVTDGVFFQKDDGDASLDVHVEKNGVQTSQTAIATLVNDTYVEVAFFYDGKSAVEVFVDGAKVATLATTNLPDDEVLAVSFGIQNGAAAAKTLSVDFLFCAKER